MKKMNAGDREFRSVSIGDGLTFAQVVRDPQLMEALIRNAHQARNEAVAGMFAAVFRALSNGARRAWRSGRVLVPGAGRHLHTAPVSAHRPARCC